MRWRLRTLEPARMWITIAISLHTGGVLTKTVQMTLEPDLIEAVDKAARRLGTTRSAFARRALREALKQLRLKALEEKQRQGYARKPVRRSEFDGWETEQVWPD